MTNYVFINYLRFTKYKIYTKSMINNNMNKHDASFLMQKDGLK